MRKVLILGCVLMVTASNVVMASGRGVDGDEGSSAFSGSTLASVFNGTGGEFRRINTSELLGSSNRSAQASTTALVQTFQNMEVQGSQSHAGYHGV